jgi:hypothetical protein
MLMSTITRLILAAAGLALAAATFGTTAAAGQTISRVFTKFDAKTCKHTPGREVEDYGFWRCQGYGGIDVRLSAGDQRMHVSFGRNAAREPAAGETFPGFNNVYEGTIEWRIETLPNGKTRPFATILRWNVRQEGDENRRESTGRVLVVTRLGPGGVCHVGYVDARANAASANELAQQIADQHARMFKCGQDKPVILGKFNKDMMCISRDSI